MGPPQDISFIAQLDGTAQYYVLMLPEGFDNSKPHSILIALHGHGFDRWQFVISNLDETRAARDVAGQKNMIFVSPDYRAPTSWMGPTAEADLIQIIGDLKSQYLVDKIILCGGSMGGASALTFAAMHPELINGVASMNGTANHLEFENFHESISNSFGGTKVTIPLEYKIRSAEYWPERLIMPIGMTGGALDTVVPPQSVYRLNEILKKIERKVLLIYRNDLGHNSTYEDTKTILEFALGYQTFLPVILN